VAGLPHRRVQDGREPGPFGPGPGDAVTLVSSRTIHDAQAPGPLIGSGPASSIVHASRRRGAATPPDPDIRGIEEV